MREVPDHIKTTVGAALVEDVGSGDLTAALIAHESYINASVISREDATLCGTLWFDETFQQLDPSIEISWQLEDGRQVTADQTVCRLHGPAKPILTGERTALNFLQLLSGTATQARRYVAAIQGTKARILDTRKTIPGLRLAQKYAVTVGGARNHRFGLYDGILIKENHLRSVPSIEEAILLAQRESPVGCLVEIEVESIGELEEALRAGAQRILLDNFTLDELKQAVVLNAGRAELEVSGGVTLDSIRSIADTGVDFISVGAITKHVRAVDFSLEFDSI